MNERELTNRLEQAVPEAPAVFHNAMLSAFAQIQEQEARENPIVELPRPRLRKRTAAIILIAALLVASVAMAAALAPRVLSIFWGRGVTMRDDFAARVQSDVVEEMIGDCRVRIEEAVYDGVSLYVTYSIRNMSVDRMMGTHFPQAPEGERQIVEEDWEEMRTWEAGDWHDGLWINGKEIDMPETAVVEMGGDEPGEVVVSNMYHIGFSGITLDGETRISLPIGKKQHWDYATRQSLPRDEDGGYLEPEEGCMSFYVSSEGLDVTQVEDGPVSVWPDGTEIRTAKAIFTPIKLYLTLDFHVPDALIESYKEEMGSEGFYWEDELVYPYSAMDVITDWVFDLVLTDAEGTIIDARPNGYDGYYGSGDTICWYVFPYMDEYPSPLYVAPMVGGKPDMTRKVLVRE